MQKPGKQQNRDPVLLWLTPRDPPWFPLRACRPGCSLDGALGLPISRLVPRRPGPGQPLLAQTPTSPPQASANTPSNARLFPSPTAADIILVGDVCPWPATSPREERECPVPCPHYILGTIVLVLKQWN